MALDKAKLLQAAQAAFEKQLTDKVNWISGYCYVSSIKQRLEEMNQILLAGIEMGVVTDITVLGDTEIDGLSQDLKPLRTLNMVAEVKEILVDVLVNHGVPKEIFEGKKVEVATAK